MKHDGTNVVAISQLKPSQEIATGQPELDIYDSEEELRYYIGEYENGQEWLDKMDEEEMVNIE